MQDAAPGLADDGVEQNKAVVCFEFSTGFDFDDVRFFTQVDDVGEILILNHVRTFSHAAPSKRRKRTRLLRRRVRFLQAMRSKILPYYQLTNC